MMYCEKCVAPLKDGAVYCHSCGTPVTTPSSTEGGKGFADSLGKASLGAAKRIASAPMVAVMVASCLASLGAFASAGYMIYHFAIGSTLTMPRLLISVFPFEMLSGPLLIGMGLGPLIPAVLLALTAYATGKGLRSLWRT